MLLAATGNIFPLRVCTRKYSQRLGMKKKAKKLKSSRRFTTLRNTEMFTFNTISRLIFVLLASIVLSQNECN